MIKGDNIIKTLSHSYIHVVAANVLKRTTPVDQDVVILDHTFRSLFGVSCAIVQKLFQICSFGKDVKVKHLLWALYFLKKYETDTNMIEQFESCGKTVHKYIWDKVLPKIAAQLPKVVSKELFSFFKSKK